MRRVLTNPPRDQPRHENPSKRCHGPTNADKIGKSGAATEEGVCTVKRYVGEAKAKGMRTAYIHKIVTGAIDSKVILDRGIGIGFGALVNASPTGSARIRGGIRRRPPPLSSAEITTAICRCPGHAGRGRWCCRRQRRSHPFLETWISSFYKIRSLFCLHVRGRSVLRNHGYHLLRGTFPSKCAGHLRFSLARHGWVACRRVCSRAPLIYYGTYVVGCHARSNRPAHRQPSRIPCPLTS